MIVSKSISWYLASAFSSGFSSAFVTFSAFISFSAFADGTTLTIIKHDADVGATQKKLKSISEVAATAVGKKPLILAAEDTQKLVQAIQKKEADLLIDSVFSVFALDPKTHFAPTMTYWKKGKEAYSGCIFVKSDSSIKSLKDLAGKKIAADDRVSTSTFALPAALILQDNPKVKFATSKTKSLAEAKAMAVAADSVGFLFTGDDETAVAWMTNGTADAATGICDDAKKLGAKVRIIAESPIVPRYVVAFAPYFPESDRKKIEAAFAKLTADSPALKDYEKASKVEMMKPEHKAAIEKMKPLFEKLAVMVK